MSRRAAMAGALVLVAPTTTPAVIVDDPDAELIRLGREFDLVCKAHESLEAIANSLDYAGETYTPEEQEAGGNVDGAWQDMTDIACEIMNIRAHTVAGQRIKARAAWTMAKDNNELIDPEGFRIDDYDLLRSLIADLVDEGAALASREASA